MIINRNLFEEELSGMTIDQICSVLNCNCDLSGWPDKFDKAPDSGVSGIPAGNDGYYRIYNLKGMPVKTTKDASELNSLPSGMYIINGKKVMVLPN